MQNHQRLVKLSIDKILPYLNNPRKNSNAISKVAESIKLFGFNQPIVVDKNLMVIAGHTRLQAAKKLKLAEVPVLILEDISDLAAAAYRLADNKTAEYSLWDTPVLQIELDNLERASFDIRSIGFKEDILVDEDIKNVLTEKFLLEIICVDELDQEYIHNLMTEKGFPCRVLSM